MRERHQKAPLLIAASLADRSDMASRLLLAIGLDVSSSGSEAIMHQSCVVVLSWRVNGVK